MSKNITALAVCVVILASTPTFSQEVGGVKVRGSTNLNVNAENVDTMAIGQGNVAKTNIGAVKGDRNRSANINVDAKNVQNVVSGRGRKGCVNIGVSGADGDCR